MNSDSTATLEEVLPKVRVESIAPVFIKSYLERLVVPITACLVILFALPILCSPPGRDQGTYLQIGQSILDGKHLYSELWDNKPPGIFLAYAAIAKVFGRVMWSVAVVDIALLVITCFLLFRFVERYLGRSGAAISAIVYACWHSGTPYFWMVQPETLQCICALASCLLLRPESTHWKLRCFAAGILCGCGFWLKYNYIVFVPVLFLLPLVDEQALKSPEPRLAFQVPYRTLASRCASVIAGFLLLFVAVMAWIVHSGAWPMMRQAQFEVLPRYAHMEMLHQPHYWLKTLVRIYFSLGGATMVVTLVVLAIAWITKDLKRLLPLFLAAIAALGSVAAEVRCHSYYFQICQPFFAALWAYLALKAFEITRSVSARFRQRQWQLAACLIWIVFGNVIFIPLPEEATALTMQYTKLQQWSSNQQLFYRNFPEQLPFELMEGQLSVVDHVERTTTRDDYIYVWGSNSLIYFLSNRQVPARFVLNLGVMAKWGEPSWKDEIMLGIKSKRPRLIIVTRHDQIPPLTYTSLDSEQYLRTCYPQLRDYISANYHPDLELKDFIVYARNQ